MSAAGVWSPQVLATGKHFGSTQKRRSPAVEVTTGLSILTMRSEADSNRCSSFCRAEPSHSAIGPFPKWRTTVGLRRYESGFNKVSFLGDKFRKDAYKARGEGLKGWVRFVT